MARLIDASDGINDVTVTKFLGNLSINVGKGLIDNKSCLSGDIQVIEEIDEVTYRPAGGAVARAIAGGVLTGGIGFLVGAAFGGRRKQIVSFLVAFNDGQFVAFEETCKSKIKKLKVEAAKQRVNSLAQSLPHQGIHCRRSEIGSNAL